MIPAREKYSERKPKYRHNVGRKDNERILRHGEHRGNRVHRENQVRPFDKDEYDKERCDHERAIHTSEKARSVVLMGHRQDTPHQPQDGIRLRIDFDAVAAPHFYASKYEDRAEDVDDPVESVQERDARENHRGAHHECAEDSPKEHAMPVGWRHLKVTEEKREDENVVYAQRDFD